MSRTIKELKDIRDLRWIIESEEYFKNNINRLPYATRIYELRISEAKLLYKERHLSHLPYKEFNSQQENFASNPADAFYFESPPKSQIGKLLVKCGFAKIRNINDEGVL